MTHSSRSRLVRALTSFALAAIVPGLLNVAPAGASRPDPAPPAAPPALTRPADGGAMIGWHEDGDDLGVMRRNEQSLGKRFAVVRLYHQWKAPGRRAAELVADGRLLISSHKPPAPRDGGWRAVASGREDAAIRRLAAAYGAYGREVIFSFHHEPHDDASDVKRGGAYGTAAEYVAAFRHLHRVFAEEGVAASAGGKVFFAYIATGSQALAGSPAGSADRMYPGDDVVDVLAHDRYNWGSCRNERWESFAENWAPLVALAKAHAKPLIPGEFGSPPGPGDRNAWFDEAARWMKSDPDARQWMWGFAYYHSYHDRCNWDFMNQGNRGRLGWARAFSIDPYFSDHPFTLAAASEPQAPPAAPAPEARPEPSSAPARPAATAGWDAERRAKHLPAGLGETSGLAASRRHAGVVWAIRDSGNPNVVYGLVPSGAGMRAVEFPVPGARNRDWEDIVYAEVGGAAVLHIVDTGAKTVHTIAEPDPARPGPARLLSSVRYAFPDASPVGCGPSHNVEAAFMYPPVTGKLHLVRKASSPAGVYRFDTLDPAVTNRLVKVGELQDASCISVAQISDDGQLLVTASHSSLRIREGKGTLASLLGGPTRHTEKISPDNNEAGTFYPYGSWSVMIGAENRTSWQVTHRTGR